MTMLVFKTGTSYKAVLSAKTPFSVLLCERDRASIYPISAVPTSAVRFASVGHWMPAASCLEWHAAALLPLAAGESCFWDLTRQCLPQESEF